MNKDLCVCVIYQLLFCLLENTTAWIQSHNIIFSFCSFVSYCY